MNGTGVNSTGVDIGPLVTVANSTAANIAMGNPVNTDKQGFIYGYTFPYNITIDTVSSNGFGFTTA